MSPGQQIVECFKPFLRHLLSLGLSRKTLRNHRDNLWRLGGEIISDLHETPRLRKRPIDQVLLATLYPDTVGTACSWSWACGYVEGTAARLATPKSTS